MKSFTSQPKILIVGNSGALSRELVRRLASTGNEVHFLNLAGENLSEVQNISKHQNTISYTNLTQFINPNASFNIILSNFLESPSNYNVQQNLYNEEKLFKLIFQNNLLTNRTLLVYPQKKLKVYKEYTDALLGSIKNQENTGVVLLGEILDNEMEKREDLLLNKILNSIPQKKVAAPKSEYRLHPVTTQTSVNHILQNLFSFGPNNLEKVFVAGPQISVSNLLALIASEDPEVGFYYDNYNWDLSEHAYNARETVETDLKGIIKQLVSKKINEVEDIPLLTKLPQNDYQKTPPAIPPTEDVPTKPSPKRRKLANLFPQKKKKIFISFVAVILLFASVPYLAFAGSNLLLTKDSLGGPSKNIAKVLGVSAEEVFSIRSAVPVIGGLEKKFLESAELNSDIVDLYTRIASADKLYDELMINIGKGKEQKNEAESLSSEYKNIYEKSLFLLSKGTMDSQTNTIVSIKEDAFSKSILLPELHELAGFGSSKTYLIIVQDNRELRANGGFILAAGSVTLEDAGIVDFNVVDIYTINKQFTGNIQAPEDIQEYLGTNSLQMHDAAWDIDFTESAKTLKTFFKSFGGREVDGVIAIDLEFVNSLLKNNSIQVEGFEATSDNFFEKLSENDKTKTKTEVFTSKLLAVILAKIQNDEIVTNDVIFEMFRQKHLLSTAEFSSVFKNLEWDGGVYPKSCSGNCFTDIFGIVESNVGINKSNFQIERKLKLSTNVQNKSVNKTAELVLANNSNEVYRNYIRLVVSQNAVFAPIQIETGSETLTSKVSVKKKNGWDSGGFYVEADPGETLTAKITWTNPAEMDFSKEGQYAVDIRKQPGLTFIPFEINFSLPQDIQNNLTNGTKLRYNTNLSADERYQVSWK